MSIDSLTWHACLVLVSVGMAYLVNEGLKIVMPGISFPTYGLALLCGVVVQLVLKAVKLDSSVDKDVITHIGSSATDFLVVFGIASIKVSVVVQYWVPIVVLSVLGFLFVTAWLLLVAFAPVFVLAGQGVTFSVTLIAVSVAALIACKLMFGRKAEG